MTWPEALLGPAILVGFAIFLHGFPSIKIGGTHTYNENNYYDREEPSGEDEEKEDNPNE